MHFQILNTKSWWVHLETATFSSGEEEATPPPSTHTHIHTLLVIGPELNLPWKWWRLNSRIYPFQSLQDCVKNKTLNKKMTSRIEKKKRISRFPGEERLQRNHCSVYGNFKGRWNVFWCSKTITGCWLKPAGLRAAHSPQDPPSHWPTDAPFSLSSSSLCPSLLLKSFTLCLPLSSVFLFRLLTEPNMKSTGRS